MKETWKEKFDKEIAFEEYGDRSCIFCGHDHYARLEGGNELVKDFISKELELAKKEEIEKILGIEYVAPHSSPPDVKFDFVGRRCGDCFCTDQTIHTHSRDVELVQPLLDLLTPLKPKGDLKE